MKVKKSNIIIEKSFQAALRGIEFCKKLEENESRIANQLFRSVTSIGANISEAQNAESLKDFIHKMKIAAKELEESLYWMRLCKESDHLNFDQELNAQLKEMILILAKIISSSKRKLNN